MDSRCDNWSEDWKWKFYCICSWISGIVTVIIRSASSLSIRLWAQESTMLFAVFRMWKYLNEFAKMCWFHDCSNSISLPQVVVNYAFIHKIHIGMPTVRLRLNRHSNRMANVDVLFLMVIRMLHRYINLSMYK